MAASRDQNSSCADAACSAFTFTIFQEFETKSGPQAKAFPLYYRVISVEVSAMQLKICLVRFSL